MFKRFLKGLAFGAVAGGAAGFLLAPRSGKATRVKLTKDVEEATEMTVDLNDKLKNFQTSLVHLKTTASELIPEFRQETERSINDFKFQSEPRVEEIQKQVTKIQQSIDQLKQK